MMVICWFLGHRWRLMRPSAIFGAEDEFYECKRCGSREHYYF